MNYWFLYKSDGTIYGSPYLGNTDTWTNIPAGCAGVLGPIPDTDPTAADAWQHPTHYIVQNGKLVKTVTDAQLLAEAQQAQIALLRQGYAQTLAAGFTCTIGGKQYTFGWSTDDKINLNATQTAVTQGLITFPILYADITGNPVTIPDQATLTTIEQTAARFFNAQHQQLLNLISQVQAATTVSAVQAIKWTPANY